MSLCNVPTGLLVTHKVYKSLFLHQLIKCISFLLLIDNQVKNNMKLCVNSNHYQNCVKIQDSCLLILITVTCTSLTASDQKITTVFYVAVWHFSTTFLEASTTTIFIIFAGLGGSNNCIIRLLFITAPVISCCSRRLCRRQGIFWLVIIQVGRRCLADEWNGLLYDSYLSISIN